MLNPIFDLRFEEFFKGAQKIYNDHMDVCFPNNEKDEFSYTVGPKYIRVSCGSCVYCFVDRTTGNILKAKSWRAPETKNPRGNIFDEDFGLKGVNWHGAVYLR